MNQNDCEDVGKISKLKTLLSNSNQLDKSQLSDLFHRCGFTELTEKVKI